MPIELEAGKSRRLDAGLTSTLQTGIIQGYVVNAETSEHIPNAAIYLDGKFALYSWTWDAGGYRITDIPYGIHTITVEADNYKTTDFQIVVDQAIQSINLEMPSLPPGPPGEWSEGVEVQSVHVEPSVAYQGETVNIKVYIQYGIHDPDAYPTPTTIFGTVKVNGQELREEFNIDYRNPTLGFPYTATQVGEFIAIAQDKSAKFTVVESPVGTYYSPFGGRRTPICTELIIPNVDPFVAWFVNHPGGDYIIEGRGAFRITFGPLIGVSYIQPEIEERLNDAYPSAWDIGIVGDRPDSDWSLHKGEKYLYVAVRAYSNCPPYWDSKEELAQVIAGLRGYKWASPLYGTVPSGLDNYDVTRGIAGWEKPVNWGDNWIYCPYCEEATGHTARLYPYSPKQYLSIARKLLEHIESDHPDHPLTEPAWF